MASVPIAVLLYNGMLLCGFNMPIKGLTVPVNSSLFYVNSRSSDGHQLLQAYTGRRSAFF